MSKLAQQNGINANMLFKWRHELRASLFEPTTPALLPVLVKPVMKHSLVPPSWEASGMIEIIIGDAVVRLHASIDAAQLPLA